MNKERIKEIIKELFVDGEIKINVDCEPSLWGTKLITNIYIDNDLIYSESQKLELYKGDILE